MIIEVDGYKVNIYKLNNEIGGGWWADTNIYNLVGMGNTFKEAIADLRNEIKARKDLNRE
jgi:ribulose 1,5-bisphosphate synthetase/thiazole synthase